MSASEYPRRPRRTSRLCCPRAGAVWRASQGVPLMRNGAPGNLMPPISGCFQVYENTFLASNWGLPRTSSGESMTPNMNLRWWAA